MQAHAQALPWEVVWPSIVFCCTKSNHQKTRTKKAERTLQSTETMGLPRSVLASAGRPPVAAAVCISTLRCIFVCTEV